MNVIRDLIIKNKEKGKNIILEKPTATISISDTLTALQRKFYNALLHIAKNDLRQDSSKNIFQVSLTTLKKLFDIEDKKNTYIKQEILKLMSVIVEYNLLEKDREIEWTAFSILPYVYIKEHPDDKRKIVEFEIPTPVRKAMLSSNGIYAKIDLVVIKGLKSKYAIILYEILKDYENVEIPEMTIEQFRDLFGVKNKYRLFQDLKKRVIEPAIKEINSNKNIKWMVKYELYKTASKYTHIKFIKTRKNKQIKENSNIDKFLELLPEQLRTVSSIKKAINQYLDQPERIKRNIDYFLKKYNGNTIEKPATYLILSIEKDYALRTFEEEQQQRAKELKLKQKEAEEKKLKEMLKKERDELLKEAEARLNSLTEQEKEELFKKFNKGMFNFSSEIQRGIAIGELFRRICTEKQIDFEKFTILNT